MTADQSVESNPKDPRAQDIADRIRSMDLLPRQTADADTRALKPGGGDRQAAIYLSDGAPLPGAALTERDGVGSGSGYDLNFENAPVAAVAKVVLGDVLGVGYTIDPRVQGTITMASVRPIAKADALYVLENALRMSNVALVHDRGGGYRLLPANEGGPGAVDRSTSAESGQGISVVPLRYVSAQTVFKLLDAFGVKASTIRPDTGRNTLIITGSGSDRAAAIDTILSFDADWMRGQSVGIFPVRNSSPEPVIAEIEKIMDSGEGGLSQSVIKFQPMSRLNSILVVSQKPEYLKRAGIWIARLDNSDTAGVNLKAYPLRYGNSKLVVALLNEMLLGGGHGGAALDNASSQISPGGGISVSSSPGGGAVAALSGLPPASGASGAVPTASVSMPLNTRGAPPAGGALGGQQQDYGAGGPLGGGLLGGGGRAGGGPGLPAQCADHRRRQQQRRAGLRQRGIAARGRADHPPDRPAAAPDRDRGHDRRSHAERPAELRRSVLPGEPEGFDLQHHRRSLPGGSTGGLDPPSNAVNAAAGALLGRVLPGFNFLIGSENSPRVVLDALHGVTDVKVLSNPSLVVLDNQPATLQVGDQVPFSTGTATVLTANNTVVNTIDYKNTGIILRVLPRANATGNIVLDIEQEISNVAAGSAASLTPTISQRRVKSSIAVTSGQTVLLAGLISEGTNRMRQGIPLLDLIPGVGDAFANQNTPADPDRVDPVYPSDRDQGRGRRACHRRGNAQQEEQPAGRHQQPGRRAARASGPTLIA